MNRPILRTLAGRLGITAAYRDNSGITRVTTDRTREALLAALGFDAATEEAAARALATFDRPSRCIAPFHTLDTDTKHVLHLRVPTQVTGPVEWSVEIACEDGGAVHTSGSAHARAGGRIAVVLENRLPDGHHEVRARVRGRSAEREDRQVCVVAPAACTRIDELMQQPGFGLLANLYTVRSATNHGFGNLHDLSELVAWAGAAGADFVGTNPLHASWNRGAWVSPYQASSRLYRNPLYLDLDAVPEMRANEVARDLLVAADRHARLVALRNAHHLDYEAIAAWVEPVHAALHDAFVERHRGKGTDRERAFLAYLETQGEPLRNFATFLSLDARFGGSDGWLRWPAEYRDIRSAAVARFREQNPREIERHAWLQFELDRQLAGVARRAHDARLAIGLFGDLALGSAPGGSDHWAFPDLFVHHASLGAPPDAYAREGQVWSLPPLHPHRLAEDGFRYWTLLLRNALRHMGALRIDHVMGLFRQFWIPAGAPPLEGAYVLAPTRELLAILALESRRARAIIIGEDLGTVPRGLQARLASHAILSSRVMYFERDRRGAFKPAAHYSSRALVTANTHDHAPVAGWLEGMDQTLRQQAGAIDDDAITNALHQRAADARALVRRLRRNGFLAGPVDPAPADIAVAIHRFLACTPAPLVGIALDDLALERVPVNLPGISQAAHASWTRRMHIPLEQLRADAHARRVLDTVARVRHRTK